MPDVTEVVVLPRLLRFEPLRCQTRYMVVARDGQPNGATLPP